MLPPIEANKYGDDDTTGLKVFVGKVPGNINIYVNKI